MQMRAVNLVQRERTGGASTFAGLGAEASSAGSYILGWVEGKVIANLEKQGWQREAGGMLSDSEFESHN